MESGSLTEYGNNMSLVRSVEVLTVPLNGCPGITVYRSRIWGLLAFSYLQLMPHSVGGYTTEAIVGLPSELILSSSTITPTQPYWVSQTANCDCCTPMPITMDGDSGWQ
jgi:hypothetical protein